MPAPHLQTLLIFCWWLSHMLVLSATCYFPEKAVAVVSFFRLNFSTLVGGKENLFCRVCSLKREAFHCKASTGNL
jgi:hypothetical protein